LKSRIDFKASEYFDFFDFVFTRASCLMPRALKNIRKKDDEMDLIPMYPILESAMDHNYAQGAFNVTSFQQVRTALEVHEALRSPAILAVGGIALGYLGGAVDMNKGSLEEKKRGAQNVYAMVQKCQEEISVPVALHADHVKDVATIKAVVDAGFTSVMIDGSHLSFNENIELTREVVKYAHPYGVTVEAELGILAGVEDDLFSEHSTYTNPVKVVEFLKQTQADCLALSYGTKHGVQKGANVKLRKEIVIAAMENLRHEGIKAPLVSHGSSTVPAYIVEDNSKLGGTIKNAGGIPIAELQEIIRCGIAKINIDTDLRLCITRNIREFLLNSPLKEIDPALKAIWEKLTANPAEIDFRLYLAPIAELLLDASVQAEGNVRSVIRCMERGITEIVSTLLVQFGSVGYSNRVKRTTLEEMAEGYSKA
jgi:fructose-bisphosphate aldolase class II